MNTAWWAFVLIALLILLLLLLALLARRRPRPSGRLSASRAAPTPPAAVLLPEASGPEERGMRQRTGETQELRRRTVHGPYRPIEDRGAASEVAGGRKQ
jgi:hypothetical protein